MRATPRDEGRLRRRDFLASSVAAAGALAFGPSVLRDMLARAATAGDGPYGPPGASNVPDLLLPEGFSGRELARGGRPIGGYPWHFAPDGQATYRTGDGGFVLVSNSEAPSPTGGGASAIRFDAAGEVSRAYRILGGTNINCAGGPTPWGTWLSCEEHEGGMVWECDPAGVFPAIARPALGNFSHEAAAVDPARGHVYLTEDQSDGGFYRFTPDSYPSLASGVLEVATVGADNRVTWTRVPDPNLVTAARPTRQQVPGMTKFKGGEGIWHDRGVLYFTTKGDRRVWAYDAATETIEVLYDHATTTGSALDAVDNVTVGAAGDVFVCEDGGNMEICLITPERVVAPFCRLTGAQHAGSEMCGVVFDPSHTRMYFSSQRAYPIVPGTPAAEGAIYEVTGPFRLENGAVPADRVFGPPAGERGEMPGLPSLDDLAEGDATAPAVAVRTRRRQRAGSLAARGLRVEVVLDRPATVGLALRSADLATEPRGDGTHDRPRPVTLARARQRLAAGRHELVLPLGPRAAARLAGRRGVDAVLTAGARLAGARSQAATQRVRIVR